MEDSLSSSPSNIRFENKRLRDNGYNTKEEKDDDEDISAMDFSRKEVEVENIEVAVNKVLKEGK